MALYATDHAYPPPPSILAAYGIVAANVYVSGRYAQDAAHVRALRAAGIAPWPNYEVGLWELVSNRAAGRAAGQRGIADAIRCGFPADGTIWFPFSVDVSVSPTQYPQIAEAFRGVQEVNAGRFLISCYGQGGLIAYLRQNRVIDQKGWLSASTSFPGYDRNSPHVCVYQEIGDYIPGHSTDRNVITDVHALHAWWPEGSPHAAPPTPQEEEDDMLYFAISTNPTTKAQRGWVIGPNGVREVSVDEVTSAARMAGKTPAQCSDVDVVRARGHLNAVTVAPPVELGPVTVNMQGGSADPAAVKAAVVDALNSTSLTVRP